MSSGLHLRVSPPFSSPFSPSPLPASRARVLLRTLTSLSRCVIASVAAATSKHQRQIGFWNSLYVTARVSRRRLDGGTEMIRPRLRFTRRDRSPVLPPNFVRLRKKLRKNRPSWSLDSERHFPRHPSVTLIISPTYPLTLIISFQCTKKNNFLCKEWKILSKSFPLFRFETRAVPKIWFVTFFSLQWSIWGRWHRTSGRRRSSRRWDGSCSAAFSARHHRPRNHHRERIRVICRSNSAD